jgi:hypothetical protein
MSFHPLKGRDVYERELAGDPARDMEKPLAAGIRGRSPAPVVEFVRGLKGARCPYTGAFRNVGSRILSGKNTVLLMWVT